MSYLIINNMSETFTPTQSGAICTDIWETCKIAIARGKKPWVISRDSEAASYKLPRLILVPFPYVHQNRLGRFIWRLDRKLTHWANLRQRHFAQRIVRAIREHDLASLPMIVHNDPELVVYLRDQFPNAHLAHSFHNQFLCRPHFLERFADCVDGVFCVSDFTSDWVAEHYHLDRGRIVRVYNGVDHEQFKPADHPPESPVVVNFVGRNSIEKAPDLILRAALRVSERTKGFAIQLVGWNNWDRLVMDDYQHELNDLIGQLNERGIAVHRPGHVSRTRIPDVFRQAHIHVVPSRWDEPFGLTTVEGMASGLATIASSTGGSPEVVGNAGLLFDRDNHDQLAEHLYTLITDHELRSAYAKRARERALEFTWAKRWETIDGCLGALERSHKAAKRTERRVGAMRRKPIRS